MKVLRKFRFCSHHVSVSECRYSLGTQVHLKCRPTSYNGSDVGDELIKIVARVRRKQLSQSSFSFAAGVSQFSQSKLRC